MMPCLAYVILRDPSTQEKLANMRRELEAVQCDARAKLDAITHTQRVAEDAAKFASDAAETARDIAASVGASKFAKVFKETANSHKWWAIVWLVATTALAGVTVYVAYRLVGWIAADAALAQPATIQRLISKLVIVSLCYVSALWAARSYRAHRHLCVVNRHRQNALTTFEAFVSGARDDDTKNAVLLEATRCIFSASVTGYLGGDEEIPKGPAVEIMKAITAASKGN